MLRCCTAARPNVEEVAGRLTKGTLEGLSTQEAKLYSAAKNPKPADVAPSACHCTISNRTSSQTMPVLTELPYLVH